MESNDILSEEESQALRQADAEVSAGDDDAPSPEGQVKDLHPDHWERIVADRVPALESISERMVSLLKTTGREFFRRSVEVSAEPSRTHRWGAFARRLPVPTSLNVLNIQPLNIKGVVCLDPEFVFSLVDVFFGGNGSGDRCVENPDFTPMEVRLVRKFVNRVSENMREAWRPFIDLTFELGTSETNPIFASVAAGAEAVSVAGFKFEFGEKEMLLQTVLPARLVEPIRFLRDAGQADGSEGETAKWRNRLREDVQDASVVLRAVLAETQIDLRDLATAEPGDVIPLELPPTMNLMAGNQPVIEGTFGVRKGHNAVRVGRFIDRKALGEKYGRDH
ncbi:MAG: flagellar motor switch protein FliM [Gammaproteobacteria bacterium]|nr:flagellar motor switch protein FliM [Gammaproteobacteria bacterium]